MKKVLAFILIGIIIVLSSTAYVFADNYSDYDFSNWTDDQIIFLYSQVKTEMSKRGLTLTKDIVPKENMQKEMSLKDGMYIVGDDIEAGSYKITCIETEGEQLNGLYSSLGDAYSSLDGNSSWSSLFGSLGDMLEEVSPVTVQIVGDYGKVIKSFDLNKGASASITLSEKTALKIDGGTCTIESR